MRPTHKSDDTHPRSHHYPRGEPPFHWSRGLVPNPLGHLKSIQ